MWYRFGKVPWEVGPREELVQLVQSGRQPRRAIDLGCGTGDNAIFLAQHGFEVTGVDYAPSAITKTRRKAEAAGVEAQFEVVDLTDRLPRQALHGLLLVAHVLVAAPRETADA